MSRFFNSRLNHLAPYVPGEQPRNTARLIKLNTNENPYPPAPGVEAALRGLPADSLRRYPDPACDVLTEAIADVYGVKKEQVFVGVGSDDVLAMGAMDAIRDRFGLSVPDDISVVGFHDIQQASLPPYSLTTMHSPIDVMVDAVVGIIDGLGEKSRENERELFTMKPVIRNSMRIENPRYEQLRLAQLETERPRRNTINSAQM